MIEIIPAISIIDNKVARSNPRDYDKISVYDETPLDVALRMADHGIRKIHLVDIDGARRGQICNSEIIEMISGYTDLFIQFGGGISSDEDIRLAFESGADMVTSATTAATNPDLFYSWLISYGPDHIILTADAKGGKISVKGWEKELDTPLMDLVGYYQERGIRYVKSTNVDLDGKMDGPCTETYQKIRETYPDLKIIASGGVRSVEDIEQLDALGVDGVIFAKAYYENIISLKDIEKFIIGGGAGKE